MTAIERQPDAFASDQYDVIVIGGGIYGACTMLEAAQRGQRVLLIERDDFGGATSWNSLRIIHGGLRYLQSLDFRRYYRSVTEQAWWLKHFADLVQPLSCLMPLYNHGLRRTDVMRAVLFANDVMSNAIRRTHQVQLGPGRVISPDETVQRFHSVRTEGLRGGAIWYDAVMRSPQRLLIEVMRWAAAAGGRALNYMSVEDVIASKGCVQGVVGRCQLTSREFEFRAPAIVNCAGPWAQSIERRLVKDGAEHFANSTLGHESGQNQYARAYNVVVNRKPFSSDAVALSCGRGNTYFCVPHRERMIIGTVHLPPAVEAPGAEDVSRVLYEWNSVVSNCELSASDVELIMVGWLPAGAKNSHLPRKSPRITASRCFKGFVTVEGVKYTTARRIAEKALSSLDTRLTSGSPTNRPPPNALASKALTDLSALELQEWIHNESIVHVDDLLLRRSDSLFPNDTLRELADNLMLRLGWEPARREAELQRITPNFHLRIPNETSPADAGE